MAPDNATAAAAYISVLIYAGAIEEAANRAKAFAVKWPRNENGPALLARVAESRGDYAKAAEKWRAALQLAPRKPQALIRLGGALLAARRFEEARTCAVQLEDQHPSKPHGLVLRAQIAQHSLGYAEAAPLWGDAARKFPDDVDFLRACGRALLEAGQHDKCLSAADQLRRLDPYESLRLRGGVLEKHERYKDRTAFWKSACAELPDDSNVVRRLLDAALWARNFDEAEAAFRRLLELDQLRASDADYIVGLGNAHLEHGDAAAARDDVRNFLRGMRGHPGYRGAALRLQRLILACFPRRSGAAVRTSRNKAYFLKMVEAAHVGPAGEALERIAALEEQLPRMGATCLFDSDIDAGQCRTFIEVVRQRLESAQPFSFIRLGDGEANAFEYPSDLATHFETDAAGREDVWWGRTIDRDSRAQLSARVHVAVANADALGIPTCDRFLRDVRLDTGRPLSTTRSGRGLLSILQALERPSGALRNKILASAHMPQDLYRWNLYPQLFDGIGDVVVVSCHAELPGMMRNRFGLSIARHVLVPPGDAMRELQHRCLTDEELPPQSIGHALESLGDTPRGKLVLVGAGYAGKVIVDEAKQRGGIALDLGSILDFWMGERTRSYQDLA